MTLEDYTTYANSPILWAFALSVFAVIAVQAWKFYSLARQAAREGVVTKDELKVAMRVGGVSAIGPSIAVAIVALSLIPVFGTPVVMMRIGMVGSVPYELAAASAAAEAVGSPLGTESFDGVAFATVFFAMAAGAGIWMLQVVLATSSMGKAVDKLSSWKPWVLSALTGGALLGAFGFFTINQAKGGTNNIIVLLTAAITMGIVLFVAQRMGSRQLREWALGIAMLAGLVAAGFVAN